MIVRKEFNLLFCIGYGFNRLKLTNLQKVLENTVEKGENDGHQHFLLYPQCFLLYQTVGWLVVLGFNATL